MSTQRRCGLGGWAGLVGSTIGRACRAACTVRAGVHMLMRRTGQAPSEAVGCQLCQLAARPGKVCTVEASMLLPTVGHNTSTAWKLVQSTVPV